MNLINCAKNCNSDYYKLYFEDELCEHKFWQKHQNGTQFCVVVTREAETILHDAECNSVQTQIYSYIAMKTVV